MGEQVSNEGWVAGREWPQEAEEGAYRAAAEVGDALGVWGPLLQEWGADAKPQKP